MVTEKQAEYTALILSKIGEIFEENEEFMKELSEEDNVTDFIHAMSNMVPTHMHNHLTSSSIQMLEHNHLANRLCFQFGNRKG